ncbi:very short patch repair endonuclease [Catenuloplanes sp. NPDC051500]|uniref:very short patch repair endonuclease n=1 Tax=Catenuloplanes sp. NPDC051500 TaxID=3363959 RepID=UPI0037964B87
MSEEAREKARAAGLHPRPINEGRSRNMQAIRRTDTKPEIQLRAALHRRGYRFRKDLRIDFEGVRVRPDIVFTRRRLAVFVDGCFWHVCPIHGRQPTVNDWYWAPKLRRTMERDRAANTALEAVGWSVVRVWEHEAVNEAADRIAAMLATERSDAT